MFTSPVRFSGAHIVQPMSRSHRAAVHPPEAVLAAASGAAPQKRDREEILADARRVRAGRRHQARAAAAAARTPESEDDQLLRAAWNALGLPGNPPTEASLPASPAAAQATTVGLTDAENALYAAALSGLQREVD